MILEEQIYCVVVTQTRTDNSQFSSTYSVLSCPANCFQEISRMESELANLSSQIQMQQEGVEVKDAEMKKIRDRIDQVLSAHHPQSQSVSTDRLQF